MKFKSIILGVSSDRISVRLVLVIRIGSLLLGLSRPKHDLLFELNSKIFMRIILEGETRCSNNGISF